MTKLNSLLTRKLAILAIQTRKAALVRNYFSRHNNFGLHGSWLPSLSHSAIFDQIYTDVVFTRVNYLYLTTFTCPIVSVPCFYMNDSERDLKMQPEIY